MPIISGGTYLQGDGLTTPLLNAGAPDGNTFKNVAAPAATLKDTTNGNLYLNVGTTAAPSWKLVTRAS